ncbi:glutamate--cysteine ligase [Granulicoccus sp. GXG6511]|uniref:glutamate--cysteine ligase n=1 Tax=Granulicoccus sp. GXG6511 TaxID=3381351 RepID=UPI003D7E4D75
MGKEVSTARYTREQRREFRTKVRRGLDVFELMLAHHPFESERPMTGLEIELNLITNEGEPSFGNAEVLAALEDPDYQTELARYNIELNSPPRVLGGDSALRREEELRASLNRAEQIAKQTGSHICCIGILPTLQPEHFNGEWISDDRRYTALNDSIFNARGEDIELDIEGPTGERLRMWADSIAPESACTSVQLHLQVSPGEFAAYWNAAQAVSGPQLGVGANSPFLFGKRLHAETRIELFKQATDTRPVELRNQGVRPRVFFGERWVTSIFDLFEENTRYFPSLLAEVSDEDPQAVLESGRTPQLAEMCLHNGTIYRWNRPIYDVVDGQPHLRVENRVLPAGPTIIDTMANAAFYYGLVRTLATSDRPVWSRLSFSAAAQNFSNCARDGLEASVYWPGFGELSVDELVLRHLLPRAAAGLESWGVSQNVIDRYLTIIEQRCLLGRNGASWQIDTVTRFEQAGMAREEALQRMLTRYVEGMHSNEPVHTWSLP